jgi:hypothetical protein
MHKRLVRQIARDVTHAPRNEGGIVAPRDAHDLIAAIEQLPHDLTAKKAATAGYKYLHHLPLSQITDPQHPPETAHSRRPLTSLCIIIGFFV